MVGRRGTADQGAEDQLLVRNLLAQSDEVQTEVQIGGRVKILLVAGVPHEGAVEARTPPY